MSRHTRPVSIPTVCARVIKWLFTLGFEPITSAEAGHGCASSNCWVMTDPAAFDHVLVIWCGAPVGGWCVVTSSLFLDGMAAVSTEEVC